MRKISPILVNQISLSLINGDSYHKIARDTGLSRPTIATYSKKLALHESHTITLKKHTLDLEYFKNIDTSEKAYILGLLYADGCNTRKGLNISLVEEDKEVIEFVKSQLKVSDSLRFIPAAKVTWKNKWSLTISSTELSEQLTRVGIHPDKSLTTIFPSWLPEDLMNHFIRGYFDGDGSIWHPNSKGVSMTIAFSSASLPFITDLRQYLLQKTGVLLNYYKHPNNKGNSIQSSKQESVRKILIYLYSNSSFSMKRKREKAEAFLAGRRGI